MIRFRGACGKRLENSGHICECLEYAIGENHICACCSHHANYHVSLEQSQVWHE